MRFMMFAVMCGACVETSTVQCADGVTCPQGTTCYVRPIKAATVCLDDDQRPACDGHGEGESCTTKRGDGLCSNGVCFPIECGDGFLTAPEDCDDALFGATTSCNQVGFYDDKKLGCAADCTFDTAVCTGTCGDGIINGPELCDGAPPQTTCADLGYGHGFLECSLCGPGLADCGHIGWQVSKVAPQGMHDVHGTNDKNVFAVGANGAVEYYDGSLWTAVDITACVPTPSDYTFDTVWTVGPKEAYAAGGGGILLHLTPTGCMKYFVDDMVDMYSIYDVWAPTPTDAYVTTGVGTWHFNGSAWVKIDPMGAERIWGRSATDIYVGSSGGGGSPFVRHFDGGLWSDVTPVLASPFTKILALFGDANTFYVGGANAEGTALAKQVGNGYQVVLADRPGEISSGSLFGGRVFTGGTTQSSSGYSQVLSYDNTTWTSIGDAAFSSIYGSVTGLWVSNSGRLFAVSRYSRLIQTYPGGIFVDDDLGNQATAVAVRLGNANEAFAIVDQRDVYRFDETLGQWGLDYDGTNNQAVALWIDPSSDKVYALGQVGGLLRRDGAGTWTNIATTNADKMWGSSASDLWLFNSGDNAGVITHWDGASMTTCPSCVTTHRLLAISGASATNVIAVGYGGAIMLWDGGAWTQMSSGTTKDLWGVQVLGSGDAWAVGTDSAVVNLTAGTWKTIAFDPPLLLSSVTGTGSSDVFVAGESGAFFYWDGAHFSPVRSPTNDQIMAMTVAGDSIYLADLSGFIHRLIRTAAW